MNNQILLSSIGIVTFLCGPSVSMAQALEYQIHNRMEILKPVSLDAMNHDSQTASLVQDNGTSVVVDITYYPLRGAQAVSENPTWMTDDAGMTEYLQPGLTTNWDPQMQSDLLAALAKDQIIPSQMGDKSLVQAVSNWLLKNYSENGPFIAYYVDFVNGQPVVNPQFRAAVDAEKAKFGITTDAEVFNKGLFGKGLFYNKIHGSCTPSAILWTTVFRALGIPTRIVETAPPVDANQVSQLEMLSNGISDLSVKATLVDGVGSAAGGKNAWANHTFVEVFVGKKWVRLNYNNLGQAILDPYFFGLLTVVNHFDDFSQSGLVDTWGVHSVTSQNGTTSNSDFPTINPYRSLGLSDNFSMIGSATNPAGVLSFPLRLTIDNLMAPSDPSYPQQLNALAQPGISIFFATVAEKNALQTDGWIKFLLSIASPTFEFSTSSGDIKITPLYISAMPINSQGGEGLAIFLPLAQIQQLSSGVNYSVNLLTTADANFILQMSPGISFKPH